MRSSIKKVLALAAALASVLVVAEPASATTYPVTADLESGRRDLVTVSFGTIDVDTPGSTGVPGCPGTRTLTAEFDDVTNEVRDFTIEIEDPFVLPIFGGNYELEVTGVERVDGVWSSSTGDWTGVRERFAFAIRQFTPAGCTRGDVVCQGGLEMAFSGTTRHQHTGGPVEGPIPGPTGPVWVQGTTVEAITVSTCSGLWAVLLPGATMRLNANPTDPVHGSDPGAEYR